MFLKTIICLTVAFFAMTDAWAPNRCPKWTSRNQILPVMYYGDPNDCRYYYHCDNGDAKLIMCAPGTVWSDELMTCDNEMFHPGCKRGYDALPQCSTGAALVAHPTACHRYYNCSYTGPRVHPNLGLNEMECPYPQLFDQFTLECRSFRQVHCMNQRVEAKDPCDYARNQCGMSSHCQSCSTRLPSCVGRRDGDYEYPNRPGSPYYITCRFERLVRFLYCSIQTQTTPSGQASTQRICETTWEVQI